MVSGARGLGRLSGPLRSIVRATLAAEGSTPGEISIVLTDDAALRVLNREWRGIDRATDVISFAYDEQGPGETVRPRYTGRALDADTGARRRGIGARTRRASVTAPAPAAVNGDLVISLDRVREQARRFGVTEGAELARLVIHGVLHLAGRDHQRAAQRRDMRAREDAVLRACGAAVRAIDPGSP